MHHHRSLPTRLVVIALCALALVACGPGPDRPGDIEDFVLTAEISGLYPGGQRMSDIEISNPNRRLLTVTRITTRVENTSSSCGAQHLLVGPFDGQVSIPAAGTATVQVPVELSDSAPESCQGATFVLTFSGQGSVS